jgi:hypothetical protein
MDTTETPKFNYPTEEEFMQLAEELTQEYLADPEKLARAVAGLMASKSLFWPGGTEQ